MADEQAAPKQPFESRVEDLFSSAVEQQVAERRALGAAMREISELVGSLQGELTTISERLDSLEVRVGQDGRGVREAATAMQEGLEVTVARLTSAVTDQLEAAQRREEDARTSLQRAVLSAVSEAAAGGDGAREVTARLDRLEQLVRDVATRPAPQPPVPPSADEVAQAVARHLAAPPTADEVAQSVARSLPAPQLDLDRIAEVVSRAVASQLPEAPDADDVARAVAAALPRPEPLDVGHLAARLAAAIPPPPQIDLDDVAAAVADTVPRPAAASDVADAVVEASRRHQQDLTATLVRELQLRLDLVADEVRDAVDGSAAGIRTALESLRSEADEAARTQAQELRSDTLSEVRRTIDEVVAPVVDSVGVLRDDLQQPWGMLDRLAVRIDGVVQSIEDLHAAFESMPERLAPTQQLEQLQRGLDQVAAAVGNDAVSEQLVEVQRGLQRLVDVAGDDAVSEQLAEVQRGLQRLTEAAGNEQVTERLDALASGNERLEGRLSRLDQVAAALGGIREQLAGVADIGDAVEATQQRLDAMDQVLLALAGIQERVAGLDGRIDAVAGNLGTRVDAAAESAREAVEQALHTDRERREESSEHLLAAVSQRVERLAGASAERLDELTGTSLQRLDELAEQVRTATERLVQDGASSKDRLDQLLAVARETAAALVAVRGQFVEAHGDLGDRIDAVRGGLGEQVAGIRGDLAGQGEAIAAMGTDVGKVGVTVGRLIGELQAQVLSDQERIAAQVRALLVESVEQLDRAGAAVSKAAAKAVADLDDASSESASTLDEATDRAVDQLGAALEQQAERVGEVAAAASEVLRGSTADVVSRLDDATGAILDSTATLREQLAEMISDVTGEARLQTTKAARRLQESVDRLDGLYDAVQGFEPALVDYLIERDRQLDQQRVLLLRDLVEQLGASLSRRERKRLAHKLEPPSAPTPEGPGPFQPRVDTRPRAQLDVDEAEVESPASADGPPRPVPRSRGPVARRADIPEDAVSDPPTPSRAGGGVTREDLLQVKGLGPARLGALVDALGSVEAVVNASVEELAAVEGISEQLARAIHEAVLTHRHD